MRNRERAKCCIAQYDPERRTSPLILLPILSAGAQARYDTRVQDVPKSAQRIPETLAGRPRSRGEKCRCAIPGRRGGEYVQCQSSGKHRVKVERRRQWVG